MAILDYIIIGVLLISSIIGLTRGLIREAFSLASWIGAFIIAMAFGPEIAERYSHIVGDDRLGQIVSFLAVLVGSLFVASMLQWGLGKLVAGTGLTGTDRVLGLVFGAVRGALVVTVMLMVCQSFFYSAAWWDDSEFKYAFLDFEDEVLTLIDMTGDLLGSDGDVPEDFIPPEA